MSDVLSIQSALPRLREALRPRAVGAGSAFGVSDHQLRILGLLDDRDPAMVSELAEAMAVTVSTMSLNLGRLEAGGFISRTRDPADRRVMNIRLTARGLSVRESVPELDPDRIDALLLAMRPEDRRAGVDGLALLAAAGDRLSARNEAYVEALSGGSE
jgi:DNA-binding MarR family transcriptional regulator